MELSARPRGPFLIPWVAIQQHKNHLGHCWAIFWAFFCPIWRSQYSSSGSFYLLHVFLTILNCHSGKHNIIALAHAPLSLFLVFNSCFRARISTEIYFLSTVQQLVPVRENCLDRNGGRKGSRTSPRTYLCVQRRRWVWISHRVSYASHPRKGSTILG